LKLLQQRLLQCAASWITGSIFTNSTRSSTKRKKHQKNITVKGNQVSPQYRRTRLRVQKNHAIRFLEQGDKVKASVFFRGREIVHQAIGRALLDRLVEELAAVGTVENRAKMEGPNLIAIIFSKEVLGRRGEDPRVGPTLRKERNIMRN
jgi:translation initiation factor IF-3